MTKVSVIIPCYNSEKYISGAVLSVLNQTYKDVEIIVVDDGSTDNCASVLNRFEGRIKCINRENGGPSRARNTGLDNAHGEYIAFLDADDVWLPDKLEHQVSILDKKQDVGLVCTDMYILDNGSINEASQRQARTFQLKPPSRGRVFSDLFMENFIATSSVMVRKECFKKVGMFDPLLPPAADYEQWLRIAALYEIDYIDMPLVKYRIHPDCITDNSIKLTEKTLKVLEKVLKSFRQPKGLVRSRLFLLHFRLGEAYLFNLHLIRARRYFLSALKFKFSFKALLYLSSTLFGRAPLMAARKIRRGIRRQK